MRVNNNYITIDEYNDALHVVNTYKKQQEQKNALPPFVSLNGTYMRLEKTTDPINDYHIEVEYWRDNGCWGVDIMQKEDRIYSISDMEWLDNILLVPITEEEYNKENK